MAAPAAGSSDRTEETLDQLAEPLAIGAVELRNRVVLAPMAGVTDAAFRRQAWRFGAGHLVGEMLGARPDLWHTKKSRLRRERVEGAPLAIQLAGSEPDVLAEAARQHWADGADMIDINFGCPAKKVCRKAAGSALLAEPDRVVSLAAACVDAVPVPVTVKMRTGPRPDWRNGVEIAKALEQVGVAALTVHGRTRACKFQGEVDVETIAQVKAAVSIPVIANGDVTDRAGALAMLEETGADAVMVGRAALGAPWLLGEIVHARAPSEAAQRQSLLELVADVQRLYGETAGLRIARKHIQWGLQRFGFAADAVRPLLKTDDAASQLELLSGLLELH